jgi:outer membrane protein OmpA-like peptidoglycan-associated protein
VESFLRSESVKADIPSEGCGAMEPLVARTDMTPVSALRDCLQANRRVEVEVQGVRR